MNEFVFHLLLFELFVVVDLLIVVEDVLVLSVVFPTLGLEVVLLHF